MWNEKIIKVIPAILFLFCLLEFFELVLIINDMEKAEKLEAKIEGNLEMLEHITFLLNEHLEDMDSEHPKHKRIKIK